MEIKNLLNPLPPLLTEEQEGMGNQNTPNFNLNQNNEALKGLKSNLNNIIIPSMLDYERSLGLRAPTFDFFINAVNSYCNQDMFSNDVFMYSQTALRVIATAVKVYNQTPPIGFFYMANGLLQIRQSNLECGIVFHCFIKNRLVYSKKDISKEQKEEIFNFFNNPSITDEKIDTPITIWKHALQVSADNQNLMRRFLRQNNYTAKTSRRKYQEDIINPNSNLEISDEPGVFESTVQYFSGDLHLISVVSEMITQ